MRVFILEPVRPNRKHIDTSSASEFGEVNYLLPPDLVFSSVFEPGDYIEDILDRLDKVEFNTEEDAFLIAGSMLNIALAMSALTVYAEGHPIQLLMYNAVASKYELRRMPTEDRPQEKVKVG